MRRTLALLALLATSWPHVVVLECALGSWAPASGHEAGEHAVGVLAGTEAGRDGPRRAHHGAHHHGGGDAHHAPDPAGQGADAPPDSPREGQQCAMVMACGLVMMQAGDDLSEDVGPETRSGPTPRASATPLAVELSADTPPPRPSA